MLGLSAQKYIGQLQKLQNRAARVITGNFNRSTPSHLIILLSVIINWHTSPTVMIQDFHLNIALFYINLRKNIFKEAFITTELKSGTKYLLL